MKTPMNSSVFSKGSISSIHSCAGHDDMSGCILRKELLHTELRMLSRATTKGSGETASKDL